MRRLIITAVAVVGLAVAVPAVAGSPHFIKSATSVSIQQTGATAGDLTCSFKEAGLESGSTETVTCNATAKTTYECVNGGNKNPSASNKTTTESKVSASGEFTPDKNGNIVGSLTLSPPSAASLGFSCPPGQTVTFVSVIYSGISITDTDTAQTFSLGDTTLSFTNPNAP